MQKKFLAVLVLVAALTGCSGRGNEVEDRKGIEGVGGRSGERFGSVELVVDFGDQQASGSAELVEGTTALSLLEGFARERGWEVGIKEYDFGSLVEAVGEKVNSEERAWIYFVNGEAGQSAADRVVLEPGDVVEWKYKSIY